MMQYLVGRKYVDDENGKIYEVEKIWFSASACAVVGSRRSLDGQVAHPGAVRTLGTLKLHYYWEGMRADVNNHCYACRSCMLRQVYYCQPKVPVQEYPQVHAPMGRVHMDITGRLPKTEEGNEYILVVKDYQTKYVKIHAIPNKEAKTISDILVRDIYKQFGPPAMLVLDRGTEFRNKLVREISNYYRVNRVCTPRFNPRSNGFVTRADIVERWWSK